MSKSIQTLKKKADKLKPSEMSDFHTYRIELNDERAKEFDERLKAVEGIAFNHVSELEAKVEGIQAKFEVIERLLRAK